MELVVNQDCFKDVPFFVLAGPVREDCLQVRLRALIQRWQNRCEDGVTCLLKICVQLVSNDRVVYSQTATLKAGLSWAHLLM